MPTSSLQDQALAMAEQLDTRDTETITIIKRVIGHVGIDKTWVLTQTASQDSENKVMRFVLLAYACIPRQYWGSVLGHRNAQDHPALHGYKAPW